MFVRSLSVVLGAATLAVSSGCVVAPAAEARREVRVAPLAAPVPVYAEFGVVRNIEIIQIASRNNNAGGAILGAVIGGIIGHQLGGGTGNTLATGAGAIGGAVAGNAIQNRNRRDDEVYRVEVRFDNGSMRQIDFQRIDDLRVGDRVKFEGGQLHRL
jgi:outer membrane lipoprotein SlyB